MSRKLSGQGSARRAAGLLGPAAAAWEAELERIARGAARFELEPEQVDLAAELLRFQPGLDAKERRAALLWVLAAFAAEREGSTRLEVADAGLRRLVAGLVGPEQVEESLAAMLRLVAEQGLPELMSRDPHAVRPFIVEGGHLYPHQLLGCERRLAEHLLRRLGARREAPGEDALAEALAAIRARPSRERLSAQQARAWASALGRPLTLVAGGPGTGKTTLVAELLRGWVQLGESPGRVALAAATGRGARRLGQAVRAGLAGLEQPVAGERALQEACPEACTVHRLLGYQPMRDAFRHGPRNPLSAWLVVVDEAERLDLRLLERLLAACSPDARVVLLGEAERPGETAFGDLLSPASEETEPQRAQRTQRGQTETESEPRVPSPESESESDSESETESESESEPRVPSPESESESDSESETESESESESEPRVPSPESESESESESETESESRVPSPESESESESETESSALRAITCWLTHPFRADACPEGASLVRLAQAFRAGDLAALHDPALLLRRSDPGALRYQGGEALLDDGPAALNDFLGAWARQRVLGDTEFRELARRPFAREGDAFRSEDAELLTGLLQHHGAQRLLGVTRAGRRGAEGLNRVLHEHFLASQGLSSWMAVAPGEPVRVLRNDPERELVNGELGLVARVSQDGRGARPQVVFAGRSGPRAFPLDPLRGDLALGYASSVSRALGCTLDRVALILPAGPVPLLTRELLSKAIGRARRGAIIVGDEQTLAAGVRARVQRSCGLKERVLAPRLSR